MASNLYFLLSRLGSTYACDERTLLNVEHYSFVSSLTALSRIWLMMVISNAPRWTDPTQVQHHS